MPELSVSRRVAFKTTARGRRRLVLASEVPPAAPPPLPRVTRLMALAIRMEGLIASGAMTDQSEIARAGCITSARMTQIMNLLHLAPDIQEAILNLPPVAGGRDPITETKLRSVVSECDWSVQRAKWANLMSAVC